MQQSRQGFRLSPQQQQLWLLQQERDVYRAQCAVLLTGDVNAAVLEQALQHVVRRHDMLRTTFYRPAAMQFPLQCLDENSLPLWHTLDLRDWSTTEQAAHIDTLCQQQRQQPFDYTRGPLVRALLLRLAAERQMLLLTLPGLCADAGTLDNLWQEISHAYAACQQEPPLSDEVVQYVQFSEWQNALLEDEEAETGKDYWRKQGLESLPTLTLPFARRHEGTTEFAPAVFVTALDTGLVRQLRAFVQRQHSAISAVLLAAWQTLLWRLTGQPEMVIGCVCDGRKYEELHGVLGLLAKWMPAYAHATEHATFHEMLE